jgi:hypothetical protein
MNNHNIFRKETQSKNKYTPDNGCDWIQMRFKKNYSDDAFYFMEAVKK